MAMTEAHLKAEQFVPDGHSVEVETIPSAGQQTASNQQTGEDQVRYCGGHVHDLELCHVI